MEPIRWIIDHAVLPPKIPGAKEDNYDAISSEFLKRLLNACEKLKHLAAPPLVDALRSLSKSLQACRALNRGQLDKEALLKQFSLLKPNVTLVCYVVEQNAALLIRREIDQNKQEFVVFESFEVSPMTEHVLAADNALTWDFPGRAVRLGLAEFNNKEFQGNLATFLEQASMEAVHHVQARARKARVSVAEIRDTTDPALISQMLLSLLEAIGESAPVPKLRKRVRDDVNFATTGLLPWRRLPFWLVLRVAAQRHLHLALGKSGRACYKLLMCIFFSELLDDASAELPSFAGLERIEPDLVITLRAKLCRRMIKLEKEKAGVSLTYRQSFNAAFCSTVPHIEESIRHANNNVQKVWEEFKLKTMRRVLRLQPRASDDSVRLSLTNSRSHLDQLLARYNAPSSIRGNTSLDLPDPLDKPIQEKLAFTSKVSTLVQVESNIERDAQRRPPTLQEAKSRCQELAGSIHDYLKQVGDLYNGDPAQQSVKVLSIFELWMRMDECAVVCCPLLGHYRPVFDPRLLDVLQLPTLAGMRRLQAVQAYLAQRQENAKHPHFLHHRTGDSFAAEYARQDAAMRQLMVDIQDASDVDRAIKEATWEEETRQYKEYTEKINSLECLCTFDGEARNVSKCARCLCWRRRKRLTVHVHEDFLPVDESKRHSIVFELAIPTYLSAYRNTTWKIRRDLAHPSQQSSSASPRTRLHKCPQLQDFMTADSSCLSFASVKKCFTETHYNFNSGLVPLKKILLPFAADFDLYDHSANVWVADLNKHLTLQHLCGVHVPLGLSDTVLKSQSHPAPDVDGPSSHQIQANLTKCPPNMSAAEFSAYQKLLAGKQRRWLNILVELGSSNLNFSNEDTTLLLSQLAVQSGPCLEKDTGVLRSVHAVMGEQEFTSSLREQIESRLTSIQNNWRETNCMELLINLSLRMFSLLSRGQTRRRSEQILSTARAATLAWISQLQMESRKTQDGVAASRMSMYGLKAALLCRRTFEAHIESQARLTSSELSAWVRASVALQENLTFGISGMPTVLRSMMIRDAKMACRLENALHEAVQAHSKVLEEALGITGDSPTKYQAPIDCPWTSLPNSQWIVCTKFEPFGRSQVFHLNILDGHFLVNGKPRGSLPLEMRNHPAVRSLFGNRNLFVYPSAIPHMTHRLADCVEDYAIHFGMRDSQIVIRAIARTGDQFEFLRPQVFGKLEDHSFDLPASLIENCFHWLNLKTRIVQVRRHPWTWQPQDWLIDLRNQCATRGARDDVILVDPRSREFHQISRVFEHFETPRNLTVFQSRSPTGRLSVELHRLDLSFHVNSIGLLYSRELKASIDLDQDVGAWYGLASKIVLRAAADKDKRSVIIPIGDMTWSRNQNDVHVSVKLTTSDGYCRFDIDPIIGRISNPPERRLLFLKAKCHAATSFCLPDPLTGHTGTEEALRVLKSGAAQPWAPFALTDLRNLASFLPRREYYPQNMKRLQKVAWDSSLTTTIQSDCFEGIIRSIETRISRLEKFSSTETGCVTSVGDFSQLRQRSIVRRQLYERPIQDTAHLITTDYTYPARDKRSTPSGDRVYQVIKLLRASEPRINMSSNLMRILETWDSIDGFREGCPTQSAQPLASQLEDPISSRWGSLVSMCRGADDISLWTFRLGLLAFNLDIDMDLLVSFIGFCRIEQISQLKPPLHAAFSRFKDRGPMSAATLQELITNAYIPAQNFNGSKAIMHADTERHQQNCEEQGKQLAQLILAQWPHLPRDAGFTSRNWPLIDVDLALDYIEPEWDRRCHNDELCAYISNVDAILRRYQGLQVTERPQQSASSALQSVDRRNERIISLVSQDLVTKSCPPLKLFKIELSAKAFEARSSVCEEKKEQEGLAKEIIELEGILSSFARSPDDLRHSYSQALLSSLTAFKQSHRETRNGSTWSNPSAGTIADAIRSMQSVADWYNKSIQAALWASDSSFKWLKMGDLLPCSTTVELLELLQSKANHQFGPGMKSALIVYGRSIAELQRLVRLRTATLQENERGIDEELRNPGHENWDPIEENPDWLLLEIDSNILIRPDQIDVARATINPASGENSVLQLNMGRGKTSIILPMAAAVLADGNNVSRLVVPKPLIMQTAQMMHSRLGGIVGRGICHIPFSRQTPTTDDVLEAYSELHRDIQSAQGLILTSHEHVLSYRLSGLQRLADKKLPEAERMINFQKWLNLHCRDLVDESDFTLSPKTQLNYPSGAEIAVDGHPFRWQVAQGLLAIAAEYIPRLKASFPGSIEVVTRSSWFPSIQFLKSDVEDELHRLIVEDIASGKAPFLHQDKVINDRTRTAIKRALSEEAFDISLFEKAGKAFADPKTATIKLLVVRGLIVHKIMILCLGKRWNVQYGLHPNRSPVAVPFAAKGVPSDLSEYGHPDVAIVLTCLSFYYAGLSHDQLRQGLQRVLTSEDAALEYERWISESTLPQALQSWNLINVDDEIQMQVLWRHLGKNRVVTNHFMNNFVFPIHARQFAVKLQASAWDVPLKSSRAIPGARTTGFSGTNDNRYMLPMTIQQEDLPGLLQTNAEVLSYLLQPRNRDYAVLTDRNSQRLSEFEMLQMLHSQGMKILIDAGAYILETGNRALAQMWFSIDSKAQSAVYFRQDNRPWVVFRDTAKHDMPLLATRLADDLTGCFVYFDEAHTRGVDLKLPERARAALTLALKQTKDNTMQAAMRLRQLGISQSLAFFAPPEVDISIKETCNKYHMRSPHRSIGSPEVIFWLLEQTCQANEDLRPLFLAQGRDFCRRENALLQYPQFLNSSIFRSKLLKLLQQSEHQTLGQLYGATSNRGSSQQYGPLKSLQLQKYADALGGYEDTGVSSLEALGEVEQERQVEVQVEAVREVEKPVHYQPLKFSGLSEVILHFVRTGVLGTSVGETIPALDYIGRTTVGKKFGICSRGSRLFVSRQFCQTIVLPKADKSVGDRFLRPVEWILWSPSTLTALVIIPEEAELLIPRLRFDRGKAKIHLIAYAAPVTRAMVPFNQLRYYSLPAISSDAVFPTWLKVELGILGGRLYTDYDEWKLTGDYIRGSAGNKPISLAFLIEWLGVRCRAHDVLHTPIGYICLGREAMETHPFFLRTTAEATPDLTAVKPDDIVEQLRDVKREAWSG